LDEYANSHILTVGHVINYYAPPTKVRQSQKQCFTATVTTRN